jgi:hemerythrin-like domain-containing protein
MNERPTFLRNLSSDHHQGLVLARKARKAETASAEARENVWLEVCARFSDELEPHFQAEELHLFPALRAVGEDALVDQALREHDEMRILIENNQSAFLPDFADLLVAHIRFEERVIFTRTRELLEQGLLSLPDDGDLCVS